MAEPQLLPAFRFSVRLLRSPQAAVAGAGAGIGLSAGVSVSAGASVGAGFGATSAAAAGVGVSAAAGFSASAGFAAGISLAGGAVGLGDGGFAECSGLDVEMEVHDLHEGGRNDAVLRRVGRARHQSIVLKRGMLRSPGAVDMQLWRWLEDIVSGVRPVARYDGMVDVMTAAGEVGARWVFVRGLPTKVAGPQLDARSGEIAIEELHIAHEGLRLVAP